MWEGQLNGDDTQKHGNYRQLTDLPCVFDSSRGESSSPSERALGLQRLVGNRLCACSTSGTVVVLDPLANNDDDGDDDTNCIVQTFSAYESKKDHPVTNITAFCAQQNRIAVGGKDRETVLWDVGTTAKLLWKAKNLPPDPQTLLQPQVWPTAACFMHPAASTMDDDDDSSSSSNLLAVGTAYHQVRIYDIRMAGGVAGTLLQQRRPISYTPMDESSVLEHRITALCPITPHELAVGDAAGYIHALDLRKLSGGAILRDSKQALVGRFVGPAGSVRQLVKHTTANRLACVGLDRMLRIYDTNSRKQLHTVYLKQRLNCVLVSDEVDDDCNNAEDDIDGDINQEDNVQDYVDSDNESFEDEDDVVEEMIDQMEDNDDDDDDASSEDEQVAAPRTKRRRQ